MGIGHVTSMLDVNAPHPVVMVHLAPGPTVGPGRIKESVSCSTRGLGVQVWNGSAATLEGLQ